MIERGLQDQGFPARDRRAMAAMQRARRKLRARGHIGLAAAKRAAGRGGSGSRAGATAPLLPVAAARGDVGRRKHLAEPHGEVLPVVAAHRLVGDGRGHFGEARLQRGAPLGRVERAGLALARPQHIGERARRGEHVLNRLAAARAHQIVRVLPVRQRGELQALARLDQRQGQIERAIGGAAAGIVTVEAQNRLVGHSPHQHQLIGGQRGAERRYRRFVSRDHHGDGVDIAFDRDDARVFVPTA